MESVSDKPWGPMSGQILAGWSQGLDTESERVSAAIVP